MNELSPNQGAPHRQNVLSPRRDPPARGHRPLPSAYEQRIKTYGGLDIVLMGIGREGNVAMNEPGSTAASITRLIFVDSTSRSEAAHNLGVDNLPPCSITMGINTIMEARRVYLLAWGDDKTDIIKQAVEDKISDTLPASYLQMHQNATVCIDLPAASHLTRIQRPWLVTSCEWTDKLIRSAIVWLLPFDRKTDSEADQQGLQRERAERAAGAFTALPIM